MVRNILPGHLVAASAARRPTWVNLWSSSSFNVRCIVVGHMRGREVAVVLCNVNFSIHALFVMTSTGMLGWATPLELEVATR